jgi:hypothetical protein
MFEAEAKRFRQKIVSDLELEFERRLNIMAKTMNVIRTLIVLTISILPLISAADLHAATLGNRATTLAPFSSRVGAFSVMMPGRPEYKVETIKTANGPVVLHKYIASAQAGHHAYVVAYSDISANINIGELFKATREDIVRILKGRIISEKPASLNGYPGRVFIAENSEHIAVMKAYLIGNRFYKVIFVKTKTSAFPAEAERYFASFRVNAGRNHLASR